ncbi:peptidase M20/M25/M40 [Perkinsela sp. CCAP 1560/4]|nr:peptidase M20/M25/M40 [Perkinsela sp. CCAP 1560/4]|eukprot:KNH08156.1 peptidase M20/M25/M40 [Perkinsela sp. CCAP 1560/4]
MTSAPLACAIEKRVAELWDTSAIHSLCEYLRIPNQSPSFDNHWQQNGLLKRAMEIMVQWVNDQCLHHVVQCDIYEEAGRTPFFLLELNDEKTPDQPGAILMYGHMDKQPPVTGWKKGTGPYEPHYEVPTGKLYGRGAADDGYAIYSAITALRTLQDQNLSHGRVFVIIEGGEESGSVDLPHYLSKYLPAGDVFSLIVCLDSGGPSYDRLWITDSLRGVIEGCLEINTSSDPIHSGLGGGVVPCPFRIARHLLERVEDSHTGKIKLPALHADLGSRTSRLEAACNEIELAEYLQQFSCERIDLSWPNKEIAVSSLILRNTWEPCLTVTGIDGFPPTIEAGNVLHKSVTLKLSLRIPPTIDHEEASVLVKNTLEADPPYNAHVCFRPSDGGNGWAAKSFTGCLADSIEQASMMYFGKSAGYIGLGASIPLINQLQQISPRAGVVVTGVLGPESNAHGPNEFLHIPYVKKLTACVAQILHRHALSIIR